MHASRIDIANLAPEPRDGAVLLSRHAGWPHRWEDWPMVPALSGAFVALEGDRVAGTVLVKRDGSEPDTTAAGGIAIRNGGGEAPDLQRDVHTFALTSRAFG